MLPYVISAALGRGRAKSYCGTPHAIAPEVTEGRRRTEEEEVLRQKGGEGTSNENSMDVTPAENSNRSNELTPSKQGNSNHRIEPK